MTLEYLVGFRSLGDCLLRIIRNSVRTVRGCFFLNFFTESRRQFVDVKTIDNNFLIFGADHIECDVVPYLTNLFLAAIVINRELVAVNENGLCINLVIFFGTVFVADSAGVRGFVRVERRAEQLLWLNRGHNIGQIELIMNSISENLVFVIAFIFVALGEFHPVQRPSGNFYFVRQTVFVGVSHVFRNICLKGVVKADVLVCIRVLGSLPSKCTNFGGFAFNKAFDCFIALACVVAVFDCDGPFNGYAIVRVEGQIKDGVFGAVIISVFLIKLDNYFVAVDFRTFVDNINTGFFLSVFQLNQFSFADIIAAALVENSINS